MTSRVLKTYMIHRQFLPSLGIFIAAWACAAAIFIAVIDPYGVSPLKLALPHVNVLKTKRVDIDRFVKPYEVWRDQPKTIFLGTSRINESIDTSAVDGSRFQPAYNAAIPASEMGDTVADLEQYFRIDGKLREVFVETYFYNFARPAAPKPLKTLPDLVASNAALAFSSRALWDAVGTLTFNHSGQTLGSHTMPRGYWVPSPWFNTADTFDMKAYIDAIVRIHKNIPDMQVQPSGFEALDEIVELCKKHNAQLFLMVTPNYPWDDYRLLSLGYWPRVEDFYYRLSKYPNVVSFSQYNDVLAEVPGTGMRFWYDPIHFNNVTGRLMLRAILGEKGRDIPENFMRPITPQTVAATLAERRAGLDRWVNANPVFVSAFDSAKAAAGLH
jgi:hypothetical protein